MENARFILFKRWDASTHSFKLVLIVPACELQAVQISFVETKFSLKRVPVFLFFKLLVGGQISLIATHGKITFEK